MFVIISDFLGPVEDGLLAQCLTLSVVGHYFVLTTGVGGHSTGLGVQDRLMWSVLDPAFFLGCS